MQYLDSLTGIRFGGHRRLPQGSAPNDKEV